MTQETTESENLLLLSTLVDKVEIHLQKDGRTQISRVKEKDLRADQRSVLAAYFYISIRSRRDIPGILWIKRKSRSEKAV